MAGLFWMLVIGLAAGALARLIMPGQQKMGILLTMALGIAGSFVAGFLGKAINIYQYGKGPGLIGSTVGALLILILFVQLKKRR